MLGTRDNHTEMSFGQGTSTPVAEVHHANSAGGQEDRSREEGWKNCTVQDERVFWAVEASWCSQELYSSNKKVNIGYVQTGQMKFWYFCLFWVLWPHLFALCSVITLEIITQGSHREARDQTGVDCLQNKYLMSCISAPRVCYFSTCYSTWPLTLYPLCPLAKTGWCFCFPEWSLLSLPFHCRKQVAAVRL